MASRAGKPSAKSKAGYFWWFTPRAAQRSGLSPHAARMTMKKGPIAMSGKKASQVTADGEKLLRRVDLARLDAPAAFAPDADTPKLTMRQLKEMVPPAAVMAVNVAAVRKRLGMSQGVFARMFGLSVGTIRDWEQGRSQPDGPARVLLHVIDREPKAVERALAA
jgi:DNA-binding transcriptional regulator YiaG